MIIDRRAVREFLARELDSYLWMKGLSREKILRELKALRVPPVFHTDPWLHQLVCFWIGLCKPRFLFLLDMGLGKSKILSDLIRHIQREKKLERALITVPRKLNVDSWVDDLAVHQPDLEPWRIDCSDIEEKRERLLNPRGDVTIIDNQGLQWALCDKVKIGGKKKRNELQVNEKVLKRVLKEYNFLGIDEIHKFANRESLWYSFMDDMARRMDYCYGTTGTLFGKNPEDAWPQFHLIDRGEALGETLGIFRAAFFHAKTKPFKGVVYEFDKRMDAKLHEVLQHSSIRYDENEVPETDLPPRVMRVHKLEMCEEQREHYLHALEGLVNAGGKLRDLEAQWLRMRQITSGYLVWKDEHGEHIKHFKENPKLDDLEATIDGMREGRKMIVAYVYTESGRIICERLKKLGIGFEWLYGGTKDPAAARRRFMQDPKCKVFVMNDEAGGTGNDGLQKVANSLYFYESPSDPKARQQVLKRAHRPGQTRRTFIYDAVVKGSVDVGILDGIAEGIDMYDRVVNGRVRYKNLFLG
jgi:hypothetical protein